MIEDEAAGKQLVSGLFRSAIIVARVNIGHQVYIAQLVAVQAHPSFIRG